MNQLATPDPTSGSGSGGHLVSSFVLDQKLSALGPVIKLQAFHLVAAYLASTGGEEAGHLEC